MNRKLLSLLVVAPLLATAALAEQSPAAEDPGAIEEIIVLAHPLAGDGLAQATDVLDADELERKAVDNIGATVGNEPGIHNSSYGAGAGRPGHPRPRRRAGARHGGTASTRLTFPSAAATTRSRWTRSSRSAWKC